MIAVGCDVERFDRHAGVERAADQLGALGHEGTLGPASRALLQQAAQPADAPVREGQPLGQEATSATGACDSASCAVATSRAECLGIAHGQIGQDLAVDLHPGQVQAVDEPAVAQAVLPGAGVDALDPQLPEVTLAGPAVAERVLHRVHELLVGSPVGTALVAVVPLRLLQDGAVVLATVDGPLHSGHGGAPLFEISWWVVLLCAGAPGRRAALEAEHAAGRPLVRLGDVGLPPQPALALARLLLEQVGPERLAPAQAAGAGHLDALGGATVCLHLRHCVIPLRLMRRLR